MKQAGRRHNGLTVSPSTKLLGFAAAVLLWACHGSQPPDRPAAVPVSAEWAGGPEGGAWINCSMATKEPTVSYDCSLFNEDGTVWAQGIFILVSALRLNSPRVRS